MRKHEISLTDHVEARLTSRWLRSRPERYVRFEPVVMCGIAGYSFSGESGIDRTLAGQALLAGIAERGADAVGYAWRNCAPDVNVHKQRGGAAGLLDSMEIPGGATQALVHVRDYTKGVPSIEANNHPIRHGAIVGIHNGRIANDDALFADLGLRRAAREMTVDSEAI